MPELDPTKRRLTWSVYATPLMTLTTDLALSIRVSMFEYVRLVIGTSSSSDHCPGRHQFLFRTFFHNFCEIGHEFFFPLKSYKDSGCSSKSGIFIPSSTPFRPKNRKKTNFFEIGQLCLNYVRSQILRKKRVGDVRFQEKSGKQRKKVDRISVGALVRLMWRAAAPGPTPIRLPRARSPGMGEGGDSDWWS